MCILEGIWGAALNGWLDARRQMAKEAVSHHLPYFLEASLSMMRQITEISVSHAPVTKSMASIANLMGFSLVERAVNELSNYSAKNSNS
ncbi:MAG: hypothetical protein ABH832_04785 [bacterium]